MPCAREFAVAIALGLGWGCEASDAEPDGGSDDGSASSDADGSSGDGSSGDGGAMWATLDERPCPDDSELTWENFGGGYVLSYCTTCHHSALPADMRQLAPIAVNLETVEMVRAHAPRVWARAADQNLTMPPLGAPAQDDRALLGEWLACGAPTNADLGMP